jgi:hypothetical protein
MSFAAMNTMRPLLGIAKRSKYRPDATIRAKAEELASNLKR